MRRKRQTKTAGAVGAVAVAVAVAVAQEGYIALFGPKQIPTDRVGSSTPSPITGDHS